MKKSSLALMTALFAFWLLAGCQSSQVERSAAAGEEKIIAAKPREDSAALNSLAQSPLFSSDQAQQTIQKFKEAYLKLGSPRILIYVSGDLIENTISSQAMGEVEQLFAAPLHSGGAALANPKTASEMMSGKLLKAPTIAGSAKAEQDRDSLRTVGDVAIEVLVSPQTAGAASGGASSFVPNIQASAIRLQDGRIIGQASTANVQDSARMSDVRSASASVAVLLLKDMVREAK